MHSVQCAFAAAQSGARDSELNTLLLAVSEPGLRGVLALAAFRRLVRQHALRATQPRLCEGAV
jgi:hypothetical protein